MSRILWCLLIKAGPASVDLTQSHAAFPFLYCLGKLGDKFFL